MHFLARLLHGDLAVTEELSKEEHLLHDDLAKFFKSYKIKEEVLVHLQRGEPLSMHMHKLHFALEEELKTIERTSQTEKEILHDLKYLSREHYIRKLNEIALEFKHAKNRDRYVRHILTELHDTLLAEARKVKQLLRGKREFEVRESLIDLLMIERHLVEKLASIEDFQRLFGDLFTGTKRKKSIHESRDRLRGQLKKLMSGVLMQDGGNTDHYISELTARIFSKLEQAVMEAVQTGVIEKHPYVDVEFVHSPLFEQFVQAELEYDRRRGKLTPSAGTVREFVKVFRDMYGRKQVVA